jgi:hypothetical protein
MTNLRVIDKRNSQLYISDISSIECVVHNYLGIYSSDEGREVFVGRSNAGRLLAVTCSAGCVSQYDAWLAIKYVQEIDEI